MFLPTDGAGILFDDGTQWNFFINGRKLAVINQADYAFIHQNTAGVSSQGTSTLLQNNAAGVTLYVKPIPTPASPWHWQGRPIGSNAGTQGLAACGICATDGTAFTWLGTQQTTAGQAAIIVAENWNSTADPAGFAAVVNDTVSGNNLSYLESSVVSQPPYFRIDFDGTHLNYRVGGNGQNFVTAAVTTPFLAATKVGFYFRTGANVKLFIEAQYEDFAQP